MQSKSVLTTTDSHKIMAACKAAAQAKKLAVAIAIVDDSGGLLQFERMDGVGPMIGEIAVAKARTASAFKAPSKFAEDLLKMNQGMLAIPAIMPLQGGVPVMHQGACVGAVGVSGGLSQDDEDIAAAGAAVAA